MPSLVDVWRAVDAAAVLVAGDHERLRAPVRGVVRTRAAAPIIPPVGDGEVLVVDRASVSGMTGRELLDGVRASGAEPTAIVFAAGDPDTGSVPEMDGALPVLVSRAPTNALVASVADYLDRESLLLDRWALELRAAMAEAALADPGPASPAAVAGARLGRGVAVARAGRLVSVHPAAGREKVALDFTATFSRLFTGPSERRHAERRTRSGLWVAEFPVRAAPADRGASEARGGAGVVREAAWLFDDVPFAAIDRLGGAALAHTLGAIQRGAARAAALPAGTDRATASRRARARVPSPSNAEPPTTAGTLATTLMAVARTNGRVAPAARALGVHRNTVLYRLRRASSELGIDPRRPDDAVRLLRDGMPAEPSAAPRARDR